VGRVTYAAAAYWRIPHSGHLSIGTPQMLNPAGAPVVGLEATLSHTPTGVDGYRRSMRFSERLRKGLQRTPAADGPLPEQSASGAALPIAGYDSLDAKQVTAHFRQLSQVELAEIEDYERSHRNRAAVLDKLRYMRSPEPLEGYDSLEAEQVVRLLEDADAAKVRAIRDYEGKFRGRRAVMGAAAEALPKATANLAEQQVRDEKAQRTRSGIQDRRDLTS
jgi:hypothetical protein